MTRVTLDTNEIVAAFNFHGKALEIIHSAIRGDIEIAISEPILQETMRVLCEKFGWQPYEVHSLAERLLKICKLVDPKEKLAVVADEPDNRILECAQEASSQYLVTEDSVLLKVREHAGTKILSAVEFLGQDHQR